MKVSKKQLKKIIREEATRLVPPSTLWDFGSNSDRQEILKESGNIHGGQLEGLANASVSQVGNMLDQWEEVSMVDRPDPRAEDIYDLLFQLQERMMAVLENRD